MTDLEESGITFSVDMSRLIALLAEQIYPSPFALLRENVQNAFDAIRLRSHAGNSFQPRINVTIDPMRISVEDNGIGMSRQEIEQHFWKAGSSSKNTDEARAAGVVGTFGIGAMANFGIAENLEVVSESAQGGPRIRSSAERATLSVTQKCIQVLEEAPTGKIGTCVTAVMQADKAIDVERAKAYITEFVRFVELPVYVNEQLVSQQPLREAVPDLVESWRWEGAQVDLGHDLVANILLTGSGAGEVRVELDSIHIGGKAFPGTLILRQNAGQLRTFRSRFGLASTAIPSAYQLGGVADFLVLQPTAGREALTTESVEFLNRFAAPLDELISKHLATRPEANVSQHFINWVAGHHRWELCGMLRARVEPGDSATLVELAAQSTKAPLLLYAGTDPSMMQLASIERPLVQLARNNQRRQCEENYFAAYAKVERLSDEPKVLNSIPPAELTTSQSSLAFRLTEILSSDYFLNAEVGYGTISHGLPILVLGEKPVKVTLEPKAANVSVILELYAKEFRAFGHMAKDFVRNVIFPKVSHLVPSATRQGAEAFLKSLQRTRDVFEYESSDLENLTSLWKDYLDGKLSMQQASIKARAVQRSHQFLNTAATGRVRDVVPDVSEVPASQDQDPNLEALPPIERMDMSTDKKLLFIDESEPALRSYRCFLAISNRIREERGEFFLQPHRTSVVWGGHRALFIFEHQSGEVGLYYDVQMREPVAASPGGGSFETSTIMMKNQIFIPIPEPLHQSFLPEAGETKRLEVRCDLLLIDGARVD